MKTITMIINTICVFELELIGNRTRASDFVASLIVSFSFILVCSQHILLDRFPRPARREEGSEEADGEGEEKEDPGRQEEASQHRPPQRGQSEVRMLCFNKQFTTFTV